MSYRAYHKETTRYLSGHRGVKTNKESFETEGAAKAAITREAKRGAIQAADFAVADSVIFAKHIEKTELVTSIMAKPGDPQIRQSVNTPRCCDPSTELYWSC